MIVDRRSIENNISPAPEIWKDVPGYEGSYKASSRGRIKNAKSKIVKQRNHESAGEWLYRKIDLYDNGKKKTFRVQRLILTTFQGKPPKKIVARHLDGNTFNNNIENLEWGTQTENILDFINRKEKEWENVCRQTVDQERSYRNQ